MGKTGNSSISFLKKFYSQFTLGPIHNDTRIYFIVYTVLALIIIDTSLNQNSEMRSHLDISGLSVPLFVCMGIIVIGGQSYVLEFVRQKSRQIRKHAAYLRISYNIVILIQYLAISIFVFVLVQIITTQQYSSIALTIVTTVTYGLTIGLMSIFTIIFFSWYKSNRNSVVILIYGLSFAAVVIASAIFLTYSHYRLAEKPDYISPDVSPSAKPKPGSLLNDLAKMYHYADIVSFLLKWVATALLLYHYSQKMGKIKYWMLISLPLIYFTGTYLDDYQIYEPHTEIDKLYWDLYTSLNSTAGGILFYIGFVVAARHFHKNTSVRDYLIMCGFGFLLFFSAGQSTLANTLYPPFGLATMSLYGLSTYMILLALYSCAISVSDDIELRKSIKKSTLRESKFLESMGTAQMERDLTRRMVLQAREEQKERIQRSAGIKSSLTDEDIINIIEEAERDAR